MPPAETARKGVLLVNLGSPDSYAVSDVKAYLNEFLMDPRVIDVPHWLRKVLVEGIVLRTRPPRSARAYQHIWWDEGSPLTVISRRLCEQVRQAVPLPVALGMRYGQPSIDTGLRALLDTCPDLEQVLLVPLYPHYAMSSYETVVVKAQEVVRHSFPQLTLEVMPPFYDEPGYVQVLAQSIRAHLSPDTDHVLFTYHGVPERHIRKGDTTRAHCLRVADCCHVAAPAAQQVCYRHQVIRTSEAVAAQLGLSPDQYTISFQSRLGPDPWLKPYTARTLKQLPEAGVRNLAVVCPAFVADCLETIEEIGEEGRDIFLEAGGTRFTLVPCLNDSQPWVALLAQYIVRHFTPTAASHV